MVNQHWLLFTELASLTPCRGGALPRSQAAWDGNEARVGLTRLIASQMVLQVDKAGVDASIQSAETSVISNAGVTTADILKAASWSTVVTYSHVNVRGSHMITAC